MALSGTFYNRTYESQGVILKVVWSATQSVANNTSSVTVKAYIVHNMYHISIQPATIKCFGQTLTTGSYDSDTYMSSTWHDVLMGSKTFIVSHNADGTKSGTISMLASWTGQNPQTTFGSATASASVTLDTIARATTPSVNVSSADMGTSVTISMPRASSSFTHTLSYKFGNASGTIGSGYGTSHSWTIPLALAEQIPNSTSGTCTITCKTYSGSTLIGTKTCTFTAKVPSSVAPSVSAIGYTDPTGALTKYGAFVQNKSTCRVSVSASGNRGSTIKAYKITANGQTYTSNNVTTSPYTSTGNKTISVVVTDSRGRTASSSTTINVIGYTLPTINTFNVKRCNADGTLNDEGACLKITLKTTITALNNHNAKSVSLAFKEASQTSYTAITSYSAYSVDTSEIVTSTTTENTYNIRLIVQDDYSRTEKVINAGTVFTLLDFNASGKGMAVGKVSEDDSFDCNLPSRFRKTTTTASIEPDTSASRNIGSHSKPYQSTFSRYYSAYDGTHDASYAAMQVATEGTSTVDGIGYLIAGNNIGSGSDGNAHGVLRLFNSATYQGNLLANDSMTAHRSIYLPATSGTLSLSSSDIRLKENVEDATVDALEFINQIKVRQFDWKESKKHWDCGYVANELRELDENLIVEGSGGTDSEGNINPLCIDSFYLSGWHTKAIQQLTRIIEEQQKEIEELKKIIAEVGNH